MSDPVSANPSDAGDGAGRVVAPQALNGPDLPVWLVKKYWIVALLLVVGLITAVVWFRHAFDDQGYAPLQPIAFSHQQHAGDLGIDCNFCHFNAARGKHAGVPPMSICLSCHGADKGAVAAKSPEIAKLLAIVDKGSYTDEDGIIRAGGVVHWNRVHKLPDHVYFSHEWHVKAGVDCRTCHGPIEKMAVVRQYSTLSMGWCLDCHRKNNYVGGPAYNGSAETFTVGTANYDVVRHPLRTPADPVVTFTDRQVKTEQDQKAPEHHVDTSDAPSSDDKRASTHSKFKEMLKNHANLPRWRVADLPETHRAVYESLYKEENGELFIDLSDPKFKSFMNAPTQCNTCHQ